MLKANKTVTVINLLPSRTSGTAVYQLHTFGECSWRTEADSSNDASGRSTALSCKVRIPLSDTYTDFYDWTEGRQTNSELWTMGGQTWLYLGALSTLDQDSFTALTKRRALFRVRAYHENRDGIHPHIYAEGEA